MITATTIEDTSAIMYFKINIIYTILVDFNNPFLKNALSLALVM